MNKIQFTEQMFTLPIDTLVLVSLVGTNHR